MSRFLTTKDIALFDSINEELLEDIIGTTVDIYKINEAETVDDIYGESINKIYFPQVRVVGLIEHEEPSYEQGEFGTDSSQNIVVKFYRNTLIEKNLFIEVGDVIVWDGKHFSVHTIIENQYLGGRVTLKHSIICKCYQTRKSTTKIDRINRLIAKQKDSTIVA